MDGKFLEIALLLLLAGAGIYLATGRPHSSPEEAAPGWVEMERPTRSAMPGPAESVTGGGLLAKAAQCRRDSEFGRAEKIYREILRKDGKSAKAYLGLGALYMEQGDFSRATEMFDMAASILREKRALKRGDP